MVTSITHPIHKSLSTHVFININAHRKQIYVVYYICMHLYIPRTHESNNLPTCIDDEFQISY